jgi:hypothetical protein
MDGFIGFAEVTGAILAALGLALGLEYATLNGLVRLMPFGSAQDRPAREQKDKR